MVHDLAVLQHSQKHTGSKNGGSHGKCRTCMGFDNFALQLGPRIIDQKRHHTANHKSIIGRHIKENQCHDNAQRPDHIKGKQLRPGQIIGGRCLCQLLRLFHIIQNQCTVLAGAPFLLHGPPEKSGKQCNADSHDLHGQKLHPQYVCIDFQNGGGTHGRTAPGKQVHNTHSCHTD